VTCIGTWTTSSSSSDSSAQPPISQVMNKSLESPFTQDPLKVSSGNPLANISSSHSVFLALKDQQGLGECLEYRRIEGSNNVLTVSVYHKLCPGTLEKQQHKTPKFTANLTFKGPCQEALTDASAVSNANSIIINRITSKFPQTIIFNVFALYSTARYFQL
jgi:hypothetical protein